jgi:asparagine synthase (glutamine-hydrolysing)
MKWAVVKRSSIYKMAMTNIVNPIYPVGLRRVLRPSSIKLPRWLDPTFQKRYDADSLSLGITMHATPLGRKFQSGRTFELKEVTRALVPPPVGRLEQRYPFLSRRLVDFSLTLPVPLIIQPHARKWILRSAMAGILPEDVRLRRGKGGSGARIRWALSTEAPRIAALTEAPILEELGCVRGDVLRDEIERVQTGRARHMIDLYATLTLETWLRTWADRWPAAIRAA